MPDDADRESIRIRLRNARDLLVRADALLDSDPRESKRLTEAALKSAERASCDLIDYAIFGRITNV